MGNSLGGGKKTTKVMKINGETMKLKTPVYAGDVVKDYPGHVLLESEAVKHYGIRAKPLEPQQELKSKRLYFLVELPEGKTARRVRSGINMSAKDRLESLMLARRSISDLSIMKPTGLAVEEDSQVEGAEKGGAVRLKMRLPRAEVEKLIKESKDEAEAAEKLMDLARATQANGGGAYATPPPPPPDRLLKGALVHRQRQYWNGAATHGRIEGLVRTREKRVGFLPIHEGEIQVAVAS